MPGSITSDLSYPSSDQTFGPTLSFVTNDCRYVDPIIDIQCQRSNSEYSVSSILSSESVSVVLELPDHEIEKVLKPVDEQILSVDTVLVINAPNNDQSFSITAGDFKEVLREHGRLSDVHQPYDYIYENMHGKKANSRRIACFLLLLITILLLAGLIATVVLTIFGNEENQSSEGQVILIIGGQSSNNSLLDSIELFYPENPSGNRFSKISLKDHSYGFASAVFNDSILLAGGLYYSDWEKNDLPTDRLVVIDLTLGIPKFAPKTMKQKRFNPSGTLIDHKFYVCGGLYWNETQNNHNFNPETLSSCEYYDLEEQEWHFIANLTVPRHSFALSTIDGRLFAIGGSPSRDFIKDGSQKSLDSIEEYNFTSNKWSIVGQTPVAADGSWCKYNGFVASCGGWTSSQWTVNPNTVNFNYTNNCYLYNGTVTHSLPASITKPGCCSSMVQCGSTDLLLNFGGAVFSDNGNKMEVLSSAEMLKSGEKKWNAAKSLLQPRAFMAAVCIENSKRYRL